MPRSMGHPDYVYRPLSDEQKAKLSRIHRKRLGIPDGFVRVYGIYVPEEIGAEVRTLAQEANRRANRDAAIALITTIKRRGWKVPQRVDEGPKSEGVSTAYDCIDTALPVVFRG